MKKVLTTVFALSLTLFVLPAIAITPDQTILKSVHDSVVASSAKLLPMAISWLGAFMGLQFILTNFSLLKSGADLEAVFGKLIGSFTWFGFCIYLMNEGPGFIDSVGNYVHNQMAATVPTPSSILTSTLGVCVALLTGIALVGTSVIGIGNQAVAMFLVYVLFGVLAIGVYMSVKIAMLYLELGLIVALAPLSFSFLGLNALKDQGIAPLKSLIALVYRMILLGILCGAFDVIVQGVGAAFKNMSWDPTSMGDAAKALLEAFCAFPFLAFLVYKSDSIAASLAGGGSSLGAADVAGAAAAGAAAGAAVMSAGSGAAGLASKLPQSMSSVLGNMMGSNAGGSTSMNNASSSGAGSTSAAKPPTAVASLGPQAGKPAYPTNKAGAPQPLDAKAGANSAPSSSGAQPAQAVEDAKSAESFASGMNSETAAGSMPGSSSYDNGSSSTVTTNAVSGTGASTSGTQSSAPVGTAPAKPTSGTTPAASSGSGSPSSSAPAGTSSSQLAASTSSAQRSGPVGTAPSKATPSASGSSSGASAGTASAKPIPNNSSSQGSAPVGTPPARSIPTASAGSSAAPTSAASAEPVATPPAPGQGASIGGMANALPARKTTRDHLDEANRHFASEKATTSISISTHHSD